MLVGKQIPPNHNWCKDTSEVAVLSPEQVAGWYYTIRRIQKSYIAVSISHMEYITKSNK